MFDVEPPRRSVIVGATAALTAPLAGCLEGDEEDEEDEPADENGGDEPDNGNSEENEAFEEEEGQRLHITVEDEDGEPVSDDIEITIEAHDQPRSYTYREDIEDGQIVEEGVEGVAVDPGDFTVIVESLEDEFDPVEEEVTVAEDEDAEVTLTVDENGETDDEDDENDE